MNNNYPNYANRQNRPAEQEKPHNPNPFDFVPFRDSPITRKASEFDAMGEMMSGYFELQIKTLTPLHVVGSQIRQGQNRFSKYYRQSGTPCIPAATIRGCLRAFIEALTASWVSQATPDYPKAEKDRHLGYSTFDRQPGQSLGPAIEPQYKPQVKPGAEMDVASYLFGLVIEKEQGSKAAHEDLARKSRVWIEDAYFSEDQLDKTSYWLPDVGGNAFMGGPKPSASSWWYMRPKDIWKRNTKIETSRGIIEKRMAEFIGEKYRGRKFYFHQDPANCVDYYLPEKPNWTYPHGFCRVGLEAFKSQLSTETFRIYVDQLPRQLCMLLVLSLFPGSHIRHKLGYGKAYGFGSIEFVLRAAHLRVENAGTNIPLPLSDFMDQVEEWQTLAWDTTRLKEARIEPLIDRQALNWLALILSYDPQFPLRFTYPPFGAQYFEQTFTFDDINNEVNSLPRPVQPDAIAARLYARKMTIEFRQYQEKSNGWDTIKKRRP